MNTQSFELPGLLLLQPIVFADERGFFFESFSSVRYEKLGVPSHFLQENVSISQKNVLRGMHFQKLFPQGKLVTVLSGKIYDVVLDLRQNSPFYGKHVGLYLDANIFSQLYVPPGCAHGFYVTSDQAIVQYKCTEYYHPEDEAGIMWNDPTFNIDWPLIGEPILSTKDQGYAPFHRDNQKTK